jgi:hypothetical protein
VLLPALSFHGILTDVQLLIRLGVPRSLAIGVIRIAIIQGVRGTRIR